MLMQFEEIDVCDPIKVKWIMWKERTYICYDVYMGSLQTKTVINCIPLTSSAPDTGPLNLTPHGRDL